MTVGIVYPDIVLADVDYLQGALDADTTHAYVNGAAVRTRAPNPFATPLITVRRAGGTDSIVIDRPRVDFQVWHDDEQQATDLANLVRALMLAMPGDHSGVTVYKVTTFSGPSLIWDTDRNLPRLLLSFEQHVRGTAL